MEKEMKRILTTNTKVKKVCAEMVPKNPPVFSQKTNTSA
jgi:hypothetical protein